MTKYVRNLIAGLSERERRLVALTGFVFVAIVVFISVFFVQSGIGDLEVQIQEYSDALRLIAKKEPAYLEMQREQKKPNAGKPTPLRTLVDKIGRQLDVTVPDMKELPDQHHAGLWLEHSVELSMREIGLVNLTKFMEEVEKNERRFPIAITKLEIRKRKRTQDSYDVKMVIATYEKTTAETLTGKRASGARRKGGR